MSNIADRVRTAQDKDGMLRRALERIIQLYTDKSHFVYELLQNAERNRIGTCAEVFAAAHGAYYALPALG